MGRGRRYENYFSFSPGEMIINWVRQTLKDHIDSKVQVRYQRMVEKR